jgi:DNA-binding NtrC family response regulator
MKKKGKIFLVDDDALIVSMLSRVLKNEGYEVNSETVQFGGIAEKISSGSPHIVLLDINLPGANGIDILEVIKQRGVSSQVIMLTSDDTIETAVRCMKLGAADYLTKPFNIEEVKIVIARALEKGSLTREVSYLRKIWKEGFQKELIGGSRALVELKEKMEKMGRSHVPSILITGESGTGKELVARCLHRIMNEASGEESIPFVAVNCSALPDTLLESELFGYEKGAFTDAKAEKTGIFELADKGTILLDEIGDMKLDLQSKILRVLEERAVRRIGGREEQKIDVTVMATTNKDIPEAVEKSEFRRDLFYRLNVFSVHIPPLRDRREDIPLIAKYFLDLFTASYNNKAMKGISSDAEQYLCAYDWPGNVRELRNVIERIVVLESDEMIEPEHLPKEILHQQVPAPDPAASQKRFVLPPEGISLDDLEKDLIMQALERARSNKTLAAKLLNISYDSLRYQIKKLGLDL